MRRGVAASLALACGLPSSGRAVELRPFAAASESYDSNVYLLPGGGPGSWIHALGGGAALEGRWPRTGRLTLRYELAHRAYSHEPSLNNALDQRAGLELSREGARGLSARLTDAFADTVDPATSELTRRTRRWSNAAALELGYAPDGGRLLAGVEGGHAIDAYADDELAAQLNRHAALLGARIGYRLQPRTRVYASYRRRAIRYTRDQALAKHNDADLVAAGLEGRLSAKLSGRAEAGLESRRYDVSPAGGGRSARRWIADVKLRYQALERTRAELSLARLLQESTFADDRYYVASSAGIQLSHAFPSRAAARLAIAGERDLYPGGRRDRLYEAKAEADHPLGRRLKLGASHLYRARRSDEPSGRFDYADSVTSIVLTLEY